MKAKKQNTLKVVVCGAMGRMGRGIVQKINEDPRFLLSGAVDISASQAGSLFHCVTPGSFPDLIKKADVAVDFTSPRSSVEFAKASASVKKPIVIGTTGFTQDQFKSLEEYSRQAPIFFSPNMSPMVNLMFLITKLIAEKLPKFDAHVTEIHHTLKKDSPSGTALRLARIISSARKGSHTPAISSIRAGDIIGEHTVLYACPFERLEITHRAHSRELFVYGALEAVYWIAGRKAGFYDYLDLMGLK